MLVANEEFAHMLTSEGKSSSHHFHSSTYYHLKSLILVTVPALPLQQLVGNEVFVHTVTSEDKNRRADMSALNISSLEMI